MDLREFHGRIYGKRAGKLYVLEPTWDSFRPISKVGWNGKEFEINDFEYKKDLFSSFYGFESMEQKQELFKLIQQIDLENIKELIEPIEFWRWTEDKNVRWWNDRPVVFHNSCISRDNHEWKKYISYLKSKPKTLRRSFKGRLTRRIMH
jgi:hypothetical protein